MTDIYKAAQMALEALESIHVGNMTPMAEGNWLFAIASLREALAQQGDERPKLSLDRQQGEQQPVAWMSKHTDGSVGFATTPAGIYPNTAYQIIPLYTAALAAQPLTEAQIEACMKRVCSRMVWHWKYSEIAFAREIEKAHGIIPTQIVKDISSPSQEIEP